MVLARGSVGLDDFTPERLADPILHALAERLSVEDDGNPDPAAFVPGGGIATLRDGRTVSADVARQFGSPAWPLTRAEHLAKAQACLGFGGLPDAHAALAKAVLDAFERVPDVAAALAPAFG